MQLAEVIREISGDLNDAVPGYEYARWTVAQLQSYVREVLITVSVQLKDLFTTPKIVKVEPGSNWQEACDCTQITRIFGESSADGTVLRFLSRSADIEANTWAGSATSQCWQHPKNYVMTGYSINAIKVNQFRVTPPVPPGVTKYVLVECYAKPDSLSLSETVPDEVVAMVKQWALYRALAVDSENNPTISQLSQSHYKAYADLLSAAVLERERRNVANNIRTVQTPAAQ